MKYQDSLFRQLVALVPRDEFQNIVNQYEGDKGTYRLKCWDQFLALHYGQIRQMDSLRAIETGLEQHQNHWYHLNLHGIKRSTLAEANNKRDAKIYEEVFNVLLNRCHQYWRGNPKSLNVSMKIIDATIIDLCYGLFPWAKYRTRKGAIKLHMQLDYGSDLPEIIIATDGNVHEINVARQITIQPDSIYVIDRGYLDFEWLYDIHKAGAYFVIRAKKDMDYRILERQDSIHEDVLGDYEIQHPWLHKTQPSKKPKYPDIIRMVDYQDPETGKIYRFLTNIEDYKPETIALIYKQRWKIETFFKWIKQNLRIKSFIGTSRNAVMTQIWIAMITYLIGWYIKHQTQYKGSLLQLFRIINESLFFRVHILDILSKKPLNTNNTKPFTQLSFGFG